jgi:hypothetical protein
MFEAVLRPLAVGFRRGGPRRRLAPPTSPAYQRPRIGSVLRADTTKR